MRLVLLGGCQAAALLWHGAAWQTRPPTSPRGGASLIHDLYDLTPASHGAGLEVNRDLSPEAQLASLERAPVHNMSRSIVQGRATQPQKVLHESCVI